MATSDDLNRLAALLHAAMIGCRYDEERDQYELHPERCIDHAADASILLSRGVFFPAPADAALRQAVTEAVRRMDMEFAYLEAVRGRVISTGVAADTFRPMAAALRAALAAPASPPEPLDVERLALAIGTYLRVPKDLGGYTDAARLIAAEYARLGDGSL